MDKLPEISNPEMITVYQVRENVVGQIPGVYWRDVTKEYYDSYGYTRRKLVILPESNQVKSMTVTFSRVTNNIGDE